MTNTFIEAMQRAYPDLNPKDEDGWPEELLIPEERDFKHGAWIKRGIESRKLLHGAGDMTLAVAENRAATKARIAASNAHARDFSCGTQCCLVGWLGLAFDGPTESGAWPAIDLTKAHKKFVQTFLEIAGVKFPKGYSADDDDDLLSVASDTFESMEDLPDKYRDPRVAKLRLSPKQARKWWIETAEKCGYVITRALKRSQ